MKTLLLSLCTLCCMFHDCGTKSSIFEGRSNIDSIQKRSPQQMYESEMIWEAESITVSINHF